VPLRNLLILTTFLLGSAWALAQTPVDTSDNQVWTEVYIARHIAENATVRGLVATHIGDDVSRPVEEQFGIGLVYSPTPFISFAPFYRWVPTQKTSGQHSNEHRETMEVTFRAPPFAQFLLSDHNSGELRIIDGRASERYYNFVQLEREVHVAQKRISPYVGFKIFYDTRYGEWTRKRYIAGVKLPVQKHLTFEPYYFRQNDRRSVPGDLNVVSLAVRLEY
jgi:Protein of unknown function (DUF2490)